MKFVFYFIIFFILNSALYSEEQDSLIYHPSKWETFLSRFEYPKNISNKNIFGLIYGYSGLSYGNKDIISKLAPAFLFEFKYGFLRKQKTYKGSIYSRLATETGFLGNYSSHMKLKAWKTEGKTTDGWRFGFDFTNAYGYDFKKKGELFLYHSGNIAWYKIDFENCGESFAEQKKYNIYDEKYKFSSSYGTGLKYYFWDGLSADMGYEHSLVFPKFITFKWLGSSFMELITQRTIDYFGEDFIQDYPEYFPVYNFLAKNAISLLFYEFRRNDMNFPFAAEEALNYDSFKVSISLTF
jgi:hypothetical protein